MIISSRTNQYIKQAKALSTKKGRLEQGHHFIEGEKLVFEAAKSQVEFREVYVREGNFVGQLPDSIDSNIVIEVSDGIMDYICNTENPQWIAAVAKTPSTSTPKAYPVGLLVLLDAVQEPGNLGTIIRTADAFGASGVLLGDGCAEPYALKQVRASMGSVYHLPIWHGNILEELTKLDGHTLICAHLNGSSTLPHLRKSCALIIGNESKGVSGELALKCQLYKIPMPGKAESLNASVAAGIAMYEVSKSMENI